MAPLELKPGKELEVLVGQIFFLYTPSTSLKRGGALGLDINEYAYCGQQENSLVFKSSYGDESIPMHYPIGAKNIRFPGLKDVTIKVKEVKEDSIVLERPKD